ncbi:hypothetical protein CHARACLAT_010172 [Characodon lateralis]|uniref:Uncharacterized protein n=1 Tax=Characodon lateralis TaxID=208331 RepID=A0ABU7DPX1_9TELE|nr:hypothetical protein [Characodon lateralis]
MDYSCVVKMVHDVKFPLSLSSTRLSCNSASPCNTILLAGLSARHPQQLMKSEMQSGLSGPQAGTAVVHTNTYKHTQDKKHMNRAAWMSSHQEYNLPQILNNLLVLHKQT